MAALALAPAAEADIRGLDVLSVGPAGGAGDVPAQFKGASADGSRVFFETSETLTTSDADAGSQDVYQRSALTTTLISTSATGGSGVASASFVGASTDGTRVFFTTPSSSLPPTPTPPATSTSV